jgi:hypothetical protein
MKKSILYVCLLICSILVSANADAARRNGRMLKHHRINMAEKVFKAPTGTTIDLTDAQFGITDVEAYYYELGGKAYYSFSIYNWDEDLPELRVEYETSSKTKIAGQHTVDLSVSFLMLAGETQLAFSQASFQLSYVDKNEEGDLMYAIQFSGLASDGNTYVYNTTMTVYAYDQDHEDLEGYPLPIILTDDEMMAIDNTTVDTKAIKTIVNGQLFILKGDKTYNALGAEIK